MNQYAMRAYAATAVHTTVDAATPHQLILMLYDGALRQIRLAKMHMGKAEVAEKGMCIRNATDIIVQGLRLSINEEAGGDIARKLAALYEYCAQRLVVANLHNDAAILDEVLGLIDSLRSAWAGIAGTTMPVAVGG